MPARYASSCSSPRVEESVFGGASDVQDDLFATNDNSNLRGYVVWQPKLGSTAKHVEDATRLVTDGRATHYWDGAGSTLRSFRKTLGIDEDAWDIYLIYGTEAQWNGAVPPKPAFWMHQLGTASRPRVDAPYLDSAVFAQRAAATLGGM